VSAEELGARSVRTLAWLGDAEFEREIRLRIARRGDYPTDRLDAIKARIVRAESQARLLERLEPDLSEEELGVVRRGRNAKLTSSARRTKTRAYRAATALEALVAFWKLDGPRGQRRFDKILGPMLEAAIDDALARTHKPRRG
jgi:ribonuclease-3 family protein